MNGVVFFMPIVVGATCSVAAGKFKEMSFMEESSGKKTVASLYFKF